MKFAPGRLNFGGTPGGDPDEAEGIPAPKLVRLKARRLAGIKEDSECLAQLPGHGESLHVIATSRMDLTDVVNCLLDRLGPAYAIHVATLGYNAKNLRQMLEWLDENRVHSLTLLGSIFYRSHNGDQWAETLDAFRDRGQRAACCHTATPK